MKTIWKYQLPISDDTSVEMREDATILHLDEGNGYDSLNIWAWVDTDAMDEIRDFAIVGTGHPADHITDRHEYVGTVVCRNLPLVWHVFEVMG